MNEYALTEEKSRLITRALEDLFAEAEAEAVLLSDNGGNIIAQIAQSSDETIQTVAALAAGSFAATRELALTLGEPAFQSVFHQGSRISIYIQAASAQFIVLAVMGVNSTPGLVKLCVGKACRELAPLLEIVSGNTVSDGASGAQPFELAHGDTVFKPDAPK